MIKAGRCRSELEGYTIYGLPSRPPPTKYYDCLVNAYCVCKGTGGIRRFWLVNELSWQYQLNFCLFYLAKIGYVYMFALV